jgi:arylesterase/paraoxonase
MKSVKGVLLILLLVVTLLAAGFVLKKFYDTGELGGIKPHFRGQCDPVEGVFSSEDITIDRETGTAYVSSTDRRAHMRGQPGRQGAVMAYDLTRGKPKPVKMTARFEQELHPHGLGLYHGKGGKTSIFVVNHRSYGHFVEIFDIKEGAFTHRASVEGELMMSPNDVIPVGPDRFYVTNDHGSKSGIARFLEEALPLKKASVLYYDGKGFATVAGGLAYANGINVSNDGKTLYVAETVGRSIHTYGINRDTGALTPRRVFEMKTGVDNIEIDDKGTLWIGAHPKLITFVRYAKNPYRMSPSQVVTLSLGEGRKPAVEEIYLSDGEEISGSSVAAVYKDNLLIGSVFDDWFLHCRMFDAEEK